MCSARRLRDHVHLRGRVDHRRRERDAQHRLDQRGKLGRAVRELRQRPRRIGLDLDAEGLEQRTSRGRDVPAGVGRGQRGEQRRQLRQRVVEHRRRRCVPGDAIGRERDAEHALLPHRDLVRAAAVEGERRPRALVRAASRSARGRGAPPSATPRRCRPPPRRTRRSRAGHRARAASPRARASRRRPPRPRPGTSCRACRVPIRSPRRARPTTGHGASPPGRRSRCPCARAGPAPARARLLATSPPGSGARGRRPRARPPGPPRRAAPPGTPVPRARRRAGSRC